MKESFKWIEKIILSSFTGFHIDGCTVLVDLFRSKYKDETDFYQYYGELMAHLIQKEQFLGVEV